MAIESLCGSVYQAGATLPGVPWFFRDQEQYLRQSLARCDVKVLNSSWIWIRSSSQTQELDRWWPSQTQSSDWKKAGEVSLATDRGSEKLLLFVRKAGN